MKGQAIIRTLGAVMTLGALLITAIPAQGQVPTDYPNGTSVVGTLHNLSYRSREVGGTFENQIADYGEVCVYCHTPHGGQVANAPLWNRNFSTASYQMYDATRSSTIDMTVDGAPSGVSMACLSCHDGTIGLDVVINAPNASSATATNFTMPAGLTNLGTDLRNDHPISVTYSTADDPMFNSTTSIEGAGLVLFEGKVQCATCHNPHTAANRPFLRLSNDASALCLTCHIK